MRGPDGQPLRDERGRLMVNAAPIVVAPVAGPFADARLTACPQAEIRQPGGWVGRMLAVSAQHRAGVPLSAMLDKPTAVVTEGLVVLEAERMQVEAYEREQARKQAERG